MQKLKKYLNNDYNVRILFCSGLFLLVGIVGFWGSTSLDIPWLENVLSNISAVLIISGIYNVVYEYLLKEKFVQLLLQKIQLKETISSLGLADIKMDIGRIEYDEYIETACEIDIVHAYGEIWTKNYIDKFEEAIADREVHIRVGLLSPNSAFCTAIDSHYGKPSGNMKDNIRRMDGYWERLKKKISNKSTITIGHFDGNPVHSLYRFDDTIVCVSNKIGHSLSRNLPSYIFKNTPGENVLYLAYRSEIDNLMQSSTG